MPSLHSPPGVRNIFYSIFFFFGQIHFRISDDTKKIFLYFTQILDVDVKSIASFHFFLLDFLLRCSFFFLPPLFFVSLFLLIAYRHSFSIQCMFQPVYSLKFKRKSIKTTVFSWAPSCLLSFFPELSYTEHHELQRQNHRTTEWFVLQGTLKIL